MELIAIAPNGEEITGTLEKLEGRANIRFTRPGEGEEDEGHVSFDWTGDTEIFWDGQETDRNDKGQRIFLDHEGNTWTEDQLSLYEYYQCEYCKAIHEAGSSCGSTRYRRKDLPTTATVYTLQEQRKREEAWKNRNKQDEAFYTDITKDERDSLAGVSNG